MASRLSGCGLLMLDKNRHNVLWRNNSCIYYLDESICTSHHHCLHRSWTIDNSCTNFSSRWLQSKKQYESQWSDKRFNHSFSISLISKAKKIVAWLSKKGDSEVSRCNTVITRVITGRCIQWIFRLFLHFFVSSSCYSLWLLQIICLTRHSQTSRFGYDR